LRDRLSKRTLSPGAAPRLALALFAAAAAGCHALFIRPRLEGEARVESRDYALRTDLPRASRDRLLDAAQGMRAELDRAFPPPAGAPPEPRREIVAFARGGEFQRFLDAHIFGEERAIGFYCDLGGECALAWRDRDPPSEDDVRVLRHELVHQHLAARLRARLADWLEEGLAEALSLDADGPEPAPGWARYRTRRAAADAVFAALAVHGGARSWPGAEGRPATAVPPPAWASGEEGYCMHLLFIRFLDSIGEGRDPEGALGRMLTLAARTGGGEVPLDLGRSFSTLGGLEHAFHAFIVEEAVRALVADARDAGGLPPSALDLPPARARETR
jgi:hypothetical protein